MIAALYVEKGGAYYGLDDVDPWDEARDARLYDGPYPVVAHPPCARWCALAPLNQAMHGYKVGDDGGCFAAALDAVNAYGGVLKHPANSVAWRTFGLTKPERGSWQGVFGSPYVTEVDQGAYGHRARKRTWLYLVTLQLPPDLDWAIAERDAIVSGFTHQPKGEHVACEHRRVRPAEANATPPAFRDVLLAMARSAATREAVA